MNKKYLIISDLDGTLLNSNGELSQKTIDTVRKLRDDGHIFCIATGRPIRGAIKIYKQLELNSIMLNQNGAYICNPDDTNYKTIEFGFSKEIAQKILAIPQIQDIINNAFLESSTKEMRFKYIDDEECRKDIIKFYHVDPNSDDVFDLKGDSKNIDVDVSALLLYVNSNDTSKFDTIVYWVKSVSSCLQLRMIQLRTGFMVEVNTIFTDKYMGLMYLESYYGIPRDRILAFGDGDNDMKMLSMAKYGFAMKNGKDTAKLSARNITKHTNDDDGVAWEIQYFLKNKENYN